MEKTTVNTKTNISEETEETRAQDKLDALFEQKHQEEKRKIEENMQTVARFERIARGHELHILEYTGKIEELELQIAVLEKSKKLILEHTSKGNELESQIDVLEKMLQSMKSQFESINGLLQEASRKYNKACRSCEKAKQRIKHSEEILDRLDIEEREKCAELGIDYIKRGVLSKILDLVFSEGDNEEELESLFSKLVE